MTKKRKLSDLTAEESGFVLGMLERYKNSLNEEDEETKKKIASLDHAAAAFAEVQHVSFSSANYQTLAQAKITASSLSIIASKVSDAEALGRKEGTTEKRSTFKQVKDTITLIRELVAFTTEAGCRILINAILLHVASNLCTADTMVGIVPEFRMESTHFKHDTSMTYGGVVDFLVVKGAQKHIRFLLSNPSLAFLDPRMVKNFSSNIYEAKNMEGIRAAIPQAVMAGASYCQQYDLPMIRGCVTNGENWAFFTFDAAASDLDGGGTVSISDTFCLKGDLSGLPQVLGLLIDWITNSKKREQEFFTYDQLHVEDL